MNIPFRCHLQLKSQQAVVLEGIGKKSFKGEAHKQPSVLHPSLQFCQQWQAGQQQASILAQHQHHQNLRTALAFCCYLSLGLGKLPQRRQGRNNTGVISSSCFSTFTTTYRGFFISEFCEQSEVLILKEKSQWWGQLHTCNVTDPG